MDIHVWRMVSFRLNFGKNALETQQTRCVHPMLAQCCANARDAGQPMNVFYIPCRVGGGGAVIVDGVEMVVATDARMPREGVGAPHADRRRPNVGLMLGQRRWRWPNNNPALGRCPVGGGPHLRARAAAPRKTMLK